jgi:transcription elongation factor Elf1
MKNEMTFKCPECKSETRVDKCRIVYLRRPSGIQVKKLICPVCGDRLENKLKIELDKSCFLSAPSL